MLCMYPAPGVPKELVTECAPPGSSWCWVFGKEVPKGGLQLQID